MHTGLRSVSILSSLNNTSLTELDRIVLGFVYA